MAVNPLRRKRSLNDVHQTAWEDAQSSHETIVNKFRGMGIQRPLQKRKK